METKKLKITPEVKRLIAKAVSKAAMAEVITKKKLGLCLRMSHVYFSAMNNESGWGRIPERFWQVLHEWYTEDPRQTLRAFALHRENNSIGHDQKSDLESVGAVEETIEEPKSKKASISGTAHRTGKKRIPAEDIQAVEQGLKDSISKDVDREFDLREGLTMLVKLQEWKNLIKERDAAKELIVSLQTTNSRLEIERDEYAQQLQEERDSNTELLFQLNKEKITSITLAKRIEELTNPTQAGQDAGAGTEIEYHYSEVEGQIKGPMARIMEAVAELEDLKMYVTVDCEYDTPAGKHSK